jgi:saccharopine dehydrogenase-like NADP-dependent oxidoreductase
VNGTKRVLALGAGLVAKPMVDELLARPDVDLTLAALDLERARALLPASATDGSLSRARARGLDVKDEAGLEASVAAADAVVSLLPAHLHPVVGRHCVEHGVPMVTTSYVSDEMRALDAEARNRGVLLLNECGLDPGIDHMMAVEVIRRVERGGGRITSFVSYCGGLPAPESADNPLCYKMSWSPRGVLVAARSPVRFLRGGEIVEHPTPYLPGGAAAVHVPGAPALEGYPNRDSVPYRALYGLEHAHDVLRGTLRYPGWCETLEALLRLGLLDVDTSSPLGPSYCDLLDRHLPAGSGPLPKRIARFLELPENHPVLDRMAWLGLFSQLPVPDEARCPLDALAALFQDKLQYEEGERDMIVLEHRFGVVDSDGGERTISSRLVVHGEAGDDSAMARTVGLPAALACGLILDGEIDLTGVRIPVHESIYRPLLAGLAERGIEVVEDEVASRSRASE